MSTEEEKPCSFVLHCKTMCYVDGHYSKLMSVKEHGYSLSFLRIYVHSD